MSDIRIDNPFAGTAVSADWAWHKAHGYQGGTDYKFAKDHNVTSPADGHAVVEGDGLNGVRIILADGRAVVIRENRQLVGHFPRDVKRGEVIAISCRRAGLVRKFEHIEGWVNGVRVPFEPMVHLPVVAPVSTGNKTPIGLPAWHYFDPTGTVAKQIQQGLKKRGRYSGPVNGVFGPNTRKGIQASLRGVGYTGPINGVIEGVGCRAIQVYAQKFGGYTGPINSVLGPNSWTGFAKGLNK